MRMKRNEKRSSSGGLSAAAASTDFENMIEFLDDSAEIMEVEESGGVAATTVTSTTTSTSAENTTHSRGGSTTTTGNSSRGSHHSSHSHKSHESVKVEDLSQLLNDGIPVVGVLYKERLESFEGKGWPFNRNQCTPDKLALAGFEYLQRNEPAVKCVFCGFIVENLGVLSDAWQMHQIKRPNCGYVRLGKRDSPTEYTYKEILDLYLHAKIRAMADSYIATEVESKTILELLDNEEEAISI